MQQYPVKQGRKSMSEASQHIILEEWHCTENRVISADSKAN
jgi:hypothetical protein